MLKPQGSSFYDTLGSRGTIERPPDPDLHTAPEPEPEPKPTRRIEVGAAPPRSRIHQVAPLLATAGVSALVTALLVGFFSGSRPKPERSGPEPWLQAEIDRRAAEIQRLELDRRSRVLAEDDGVVRTALEELLDANLRLGERNALSIDQALDLDDKLEFFVERYRQVAEGERPGSDRQEAATALVEQGQRFRQALAGVLTALEAESTESGQRAQELRARLREREIQGREVRVIHDPSRIADARRAVELLTQAGARAELVASEVESPGRYKGRLFYHGEPARDAARAIADLVGEIEYLQPEAVGLAQPFVSLWIVSAGPEQVSRPL